MSSGRAIFAFAVVCCLISGSSAWWNSNWSPERPRDCPSVNNNTNVCSYLEEYRDAICLRIEYCDDNEEEEESGEERKRRQDADGDDDNDEDHESGDGDEESWSSSCILGMRFTRTRCTLYRCDHRCCPGYVYRNGRCREESSGFECQNGGTKIEMAYGLHRCECPPGFKGKKCQKPICDCEYGECTVKDGNPYCECQEGFTGEHCENAICTLECHNGGTCYSDGHSNVCKCTEGYVGRLCNETYENPESCPVPSYHSEDDCQLQCLSNADCPHGQVCCNEGSNMICREPKPSACHHNGKSYEIGELFSPNPCTRCRCNEDGTPTCATISCGVPICEGGVEPITRDGDCCPSCPEACHHKGKTYAHGSTFKDDCNTCRCYDGSAGCTEMACPPPEKCEHKGVEYDDGVSFKDDCNTCHCSNGKVSCTEMYCAPKNCTTEDGTVHASGTTFDVDCNTCRCYDGNMACTLLACVTDAPGCTYNGTTYQEGESFKVDCNDCRCTNGAIACTKKYCECTLNCQNDGKCVRKDNVDSCYCFPPYRGEHCEIKYENSEKCPVPDPSTMEPTDNCRTHCESDADCATGSYCCMEGCHMLCRSPKDVKCHHNGQEFNPGDTYQSNPCEHCRCTETGFMACMVIDCALPLCPDGQEPVTKKDQCCPVCPDPLPPVIKCPKDIMELRIPATSSNVTLTSQNTYVKAKNGQGQELKVRFDPPTVRHCRCYDSDRAVQWAVASVSDNGFLERCRVAFVVKDVTAPRFRSCPDDLYIFEDQEITYKRPNYTDNVAVIGTRCDMAPYNRTYDLGDHMFTFEIWDFDRNYAACNFKLSVSSRETSFPNLPEGLKDRSKGPKVALIVAPIAGLIGIIFMIVALLMCCRFRRAKNSSTLESRPAVRSCEAYDNHIYAVPDDVKAPEYNSYPPNPPAYQSDNVSMKSDYTFLPPPEYKEVEELKAPAGYVNPDYVSIEGDETPENKQSTDI